MTLPVICSNPYCVGTDSAIDASHRGEEEREAKS